MESLQSCSGPWLQENEFRTAPEPCPAGHCAGAGSRRTQSKSKWKLGWIQPSDELRLQKWCFILGFFLEKAGGFQGIKDILYLYFRGEGNSYSSAKSYEVVGEPFPQGFFLLQLNPEHRGCQSFGGQGPEVLLGPSQLGDEELAPRWLRWEDQIDDSGSLGHLLVTTSDLGMGQRRDRVGPCPPGPTPGELGA